MNGPLAALLGFLVFIAAGDLAGRWLAPSLRETAAGRWGVALILGPGVISFACFAVDLAGVPLGSTLSYAIAFVVVATMLVMPRERRSNDRDTREKESVEWAERVTRIACITTIVGCVLLGAAFTFATPPYKDSLVNWSYKALVFWRDGTVRTDDLFVADRHLYHPNYPLLVPLAQVFLFGFAGEPIDRAARAFQALPHLGIAILAIAAFARDRRSTAALVVGALVAAIPHFYKADVQFRFAGSVPSGYADPTYAALTSAAMIGVLRWFDRRTPGDLRFSACCLGLAIFTKNEALPFTAASAIAFIVAALVTRMGRASIPRPTTIAAGAMIAGAIAIPWLVFRSHIPEIDENYQHLLTAENLTAGFWRLRLVSVFAAQCVLSFEDYGAIWLLSLGALAVRPTGLRDPGALFLVLVIGAMAVVYAAVFIVTSLPIVDSLATSIPRTFFHLAPIAVLLAARLLLPQRNPPS